MTRRNQSEEEIVYSHNKGDHSISPYDDTGIVHNGFTHQEARDLGFLDPTEAKDFKLGIITLEDSEDIDTQMQLDFNTINIETKVAPEPSDEIEVELGSVASRDFTPRARTYRGRRKLSNTPSAVRARKRRKQKKIDIGRRIQENADPFGADMGAR